VGATVGGPSLADYDAIFTTPALAKSARPCSPIWSNSRMRKTFRARDVVVHADLSRAHYA